MYLQCPYCSGRVLCMLWPVLVTTFYWDSVIDFYHGIPVVSMANCISGLYSPGLCSVMELLKPIKKTRLLIPLEQFYIQKHHQENKLITEQHPGEHNPLIQLAIDTTKTSHEQNQ